VPLPDVCLKLPPDMGKTGGKLVTTPHPLFFSQPCWLFFSPALLLNPTSLCAFTHCFVLSFGPHFGLASLHELKEGAVQEKKLNKSL